MVSKGYHIIDNNHHLWGKMFHYPCITDKEIRTKMDQKIEADLGSQWRKWNNNHALWCQSIRKGKLLKFHSKMPSLPAATYLTHNPNKFGFSSFCVHGRFKGNMPSLMPGTTLGTLHTLLHLSFGTLWNKQYPTWTDRVGS